MVIGNRPRIGQDSPGTSTKEGAAMEKCCVFVDGENLRHSIVSLFQGEFEKEEYLPKKADWTSLFDWLVGQVDPDVKRLRTYWYTIEHLDFKPYLPLPRDETLLKNVLSRHKPYKIELDKLDPADLHMRLGEMASECDQYASRMKARFEGWRRIQDGIAHAHKAVEFRRAGAILYNIFTGQLGQEKAVDVKLATDMIELRSIYEIALIVSGDQDYVPAVQVVKDSGKTVINVAFEARNGRLLPGGARRLNQLTDHALTIKYAELKEFLHL
jgi:uncharacterized LabA/DUF88 family protein